MAAMLFSGGNDYKAYLWDTESGLVLRTFEANERHVLPYNAMAI